MKIAGRLAAGLALALLAAASAAFVHEPGFEHGLRYGAGFTFIGFAPDDRSALPRKDIVDRLALQLGGGIDLRIATGRSATPTRTPRI